MPAAVLCTLHAYLRMDYIWQTPQPGFPHHPQQEWVRSAIPPSIQQRVMNDYLDQPEDAVQIPLSQILEKYRSTGSSQPPQPLQPATKGGTGSSRRLLPQAYSGKDEDTNRQTGETTEMATGKMDAGQKIGLQDQAKAFAVTTRVTESDQVRDLSVKELKARVVRRPLPKCSLAIMIHVEKTGGTYIRNKMVNQKEYIIWQDHYIHQESDMFGLIKKATEDIDGWIADHPNLFVEIHAQRKNWIPFLDAAAGLRNATAFSMAGCKLLTFTHLRQPFYFYRSCLHDSFDHSVYLDSFRKHVEPEQQYTDLKWHFKFGQFAHELKNLMVRQMYNYCNDNVVSFDEVKQFQEEVPIHVVSMAEQLLDHLDFVGLTGRPELTELALQEYLGIQSIELRSQLSHGTIHSKAHAMAYHAEEEWLLQNAAIDAKYDQQLYLKAKSKLVAFLQQIPDYLNQIILLEELRSRHE